jgi:hypothetical protein
MTLISVIDQARPARSSPALPQREIAMDKRVEIGREFIISK